MRDLPTSPKTGLIPDGRLGRILAPLVEAIQGEGERERGNAPRPKKGTDRKRDPGQGFNPYLPRKLCTRKAAS